MTRHRCVIRIMVELEEISPIVTIVVLERQYEKRFEGERSKWIYVACLFWVLKW